MSVYDFKVKKGNGETISLDEYKGKVVLIINSATECGFTPQYSELEALYKKYADQDFVILDFPCNQFGNQAPGSNEDIAHFCESRYGITFPIFSKIEVNGDNADPLYKYLVSQKGFQGFDDAHAITPVLKDILGKANPNYDKEPSIKWNFTKFLIDKNGNVVNRFEPTKDLSIVEAEIKKLLD